ncbi:HAD domain-containing protein [Ralstonia sp. R-29]|uniref:HAD domain-containing protein n=1 Tax=Ralstonia sp. R-29 TaxID=3404059 RepID=UPI003CE709AF
MGAVLFLDFDGCLHPDNVRRIDGAPVLLTEGSELFEHAGLLVDLLAPYPDLQLVLSTSWVKVFGQDEALRRLPPELQRRVVGTTYEYCTDVYEWCELSRFDQVMRYFAGKHVESWLALDDDNDRWPEFFEKNLVCPNPRLGLGERRAQEELADKLARLHHECQRHRQPSEA